MTGAKGPPDRGRSSGGPGIPPGARFWEDSFRNHESGWFFGAEPSTLARRLLHFFRLMEIPTRGRLFDIGCGEGRDAALFASLGFDVEAIDGAPTGVARAREAVARGGHRGEIRLGDLSKIVWGGPFDAIVANQSVQFAGLEAPRVIGEIRSHTRPGGFNAIGMFLREEGEGRYDPDTYLLEQGELPATYRDWKLLEYGESILWSPRREGYLSVATLIARRPE